jgi:hypothetical protein
MSICEDCIETCEDCGEVFLKDGMFIHDDDCYYCTDCYNRIKNDEIPDEEKEIEKETITHELA